MPRRVQGTYDCRRKAQDGVYAPEPGACAACADTLVDNLTVQEMLLYTAEMKLEMEVGMTEKRARVEALLRQLALEPCRNVRIGGSMQRGISGVLLRLHRAFLSAAGSGSEEFVTIAWAAAHGCLLRGRLQLLTQQQHAAATILACCSKSWSPPHHAG